MDWINHFLSHSEFLEMGHGQSEEDKNLGLGWLYYSLVRILKPTTGVCIGSWRGFVPILIGKAMQENINKGGLIFIDPSLADEFWTTPVKVDAWFKSFGVENIRHILMTTQEFTKHPSYSDIKEIDFLFIDGYHTAEQAKFDFLTFESMLSDKAIILFHDSIRPMVSDIYGDSKEYTHTVYQYMEELKKRKDFQHLDFEEGSGVTVFKKIKFTGL